ncbi:N-acetylgalactosamine-N,N'-diacetylbacillosaminyl-diphospho-undecaprenol 4-alpha-N-acetylgalactosaminyltransferase [Sphingomonas gellani]|uniref:N-acetylgalactosamine-N,N'-diacetylbacillosaminyl-diphospho-undecaprenol 4-alpha-N-acetylgalactosaminyltransferase n=1 Tax=Sphingomonas gellani TaxID=1166340 RepID=A0A1H8HWX6_9SPHN|nr:glycosyltransferase [Sphingomonas gellani]SEN60612.1 N-acetylgalactosamine-N,N'-diacetylbacillosaminyl-diphospho-undecaprenol 4-alpha-N-acetylgalactosaminyltransferase [Sphingomonas gellani]
MTRGPVLFVINSLAGGGAERVMLTLLAGSQGQMAQNPFELALLDDEPDAYPPPVWLPLARLSTGGSMARGLRSLLALARRRRPRLMVSFLTRANVLCVIVGRMLGCRTVISERVNTSAHLAGPRHRVSRLLVRATYRFADRVIAVSDGVADDLVANFGVRRDRIVVIGNPVDLDNVTSRGGEAVPLPCAPPFIAAMGRLTPTKNMALLVDAYAASGVDVPLVIMGEGPERDVLAAQIARLGLSGRVYLAGFQKNPYAVLAHAALYVSASNGEGFPNALVEAMALGRPVVVTNCASGPSEILADRARESVTGTLETPSGLLVPMNDATALAEAIADVMADPQRRERQGAAGHEVASAYGVERAVSRYWAAFDLDHGFPLTGSS